MDYANEMGNLYADIGSANFINSLISSQDKSVRSYARTVLNK